MKLWGGRFTKATDALVEEYTASIQFDQQLAEEDILGSLAHVKMLGKCGILTEEEVKQISDGLKRVREKIRDGKVEFSVSNEDIHMNIERMLIDEIRIGRRETAHRTQPKRSGSDGYASLFACASGRICGTDHQAATRTVAASERKHGYDLAGLHASATGATDLVRASSHGLCIHVAA